MPRSEGSVAALDTLDPVPIDDPLDDVPIESIEPVPTGPVAELPVVEPEPVADELDDAEPLAPPSVPLVPMLPPLDVPEPTDALGLNDCASRLQASKSACVGSAARAGPHTPTMPAMAKTAVA
jgi:hypothetical protein